MFLIIEATTFMKNHRIVPEKNNLIKNDVVCKSIMSLISEYPNFLPSGN